METTSLNDNSKSAGCQIYVILDAAAGAAERLTAVLAVAPVACVLIRRRAGEAVDTPQIKALVETAQAQGVAALIEGDANLARVVRADGVHLPWSTSLAAALGEAREIVGARGMIGVEIAAEADDGRHVAMELAEAGADYIAFGPGERQQDLIDWWAPIFEVPCVAFDIAGPDGAFLAARSGAEFVTVPLRAGTSPADCAALVRSVQQAVAPDPQREHRQ